MAIFKNEVASVLNRRGHFKEANDYYEGNIPETFASARLRHAFRTTGDRSRLNFCRPVVEAVNDRLEIAHITADTKAGTAKIAEIWDNNDLGLEAQEVHRMALVYGECYVMAWPDDEGQILISYNAPTNTSLVYDPENPRKKLYAVKIWRVSESENRMNIYTADEVRKYRALGAEVSEGTQWTQIDSVDNPFGEVPVFHFRTGRPNGRPEHASAYDAQNAINKLFVTNMFTVDYLGAPQRYAITNQFEGDTNDFNEDDTDRENIGSLKNGPGELWYLKGVTNVGEFKPADADAFWKPIEKLRDTIGKLTNTPAHYLAPTINNPYGSAIRAAEAPLLKKINDRQISFGYAWRDLLRFGLKVEGITTKDVIVSWNTHESLDEVERWDVTLKKINAGLSYHQALREGGYTDDQIENIMTERAEEQEAGMLYNSNGQTVRTPQARQDVNNDATTPLDGGNATDENGNEKKENGVVKATR